MFKRKQTKTTADILVFGSAEVSSANATTFLTPPESASSIKKSVSDQQITPAPSTTQEQRPTLTEILAELCLDRSETFSDASQLVQVFKTTSNSKLRDDLVKLSEQLLKSFREHATRSSPVVAAVTPLAALPAKEIVTTLLSLLFESIKDHKDIRKAWLFEGLADALQIADPVFVTFDALRTILDAIFRQVDKLEDSSEADEKAALLAVLARIIDVFAAKGPQEKGDQSKPSKSVLPKEERDRAISALQKMADPSAPLSYQYQIWFARQQIEHRISSDESKYMFAARMAVYAVSAVKAITHIAASHGCCLSEYRVLIENVCHIVKELRERSGANKEALWPLLITHVTTLLRNVDQSLDQRSALYDVVLDACAGDSWHFKYGVLSTIQCVLKESPAIVVAEDSVLSATLNDMLLSIFTILLDQNDKMKVADREKQHTLELMKLTIQLLVFMAQSGFAAMRQQAQARLTQIRFLLDDSYHQDIRRFFERLLIEFAGTNVIERLPSLSPSEQAAAMIGERELQTAAFFDEARRTALPIESIVADMRTEHLARLRDPRSRGGEIALYVETLAGSTRDSPRDRNSVASKSVREFIQQELEQLANKNRSRTLLLLQGGAGSGKSLLLDLVFRERLEKYEWGGIIPLLISLPTLKDPNKDIILQTLLKYGCTQEQALRIKKERKLILLIDGYDEIKSGKNLWWTNELDDWEAVVVIGCRTEYIDNFKGDRLMFYTGRDRQTGNAPREIYLLPFDKDQRHQFWNKLENFLNDPTLPPDWYINNAAEATSSLVSLAVSAKSWTADRYDRTVSQITGLEALLSTPFILTIVTIVLPTMREIDSGVRLQRADVYQAFLDFWTERMAERLRKGREKLPEAFDAKTSFNEYGRDLAFEMLVREQMSIVAQLGSYLMLNEDNKHWARFFDRLKPEVLLAMQGVPLRRDGQRIGFIHKSVMEFYTAQVLIDAIQEASDQPLLSESSPLNRKLIVQEPSILSFIAEMISRRRYLVAPLINIVQQSAKRKDINIASTNAATLLAVIDEPLTYMNLRGIRIPEANMSCSVLSGSDLSGADLRRVKFDQACLDGAILDGALFDQHVSFGEYPSLLHESEVDQIAISPDSQLIATAADDEVVRLWSAETCSYLRSLPGTFSCKGLDFSPDGRTLLIADQRARCSMLFDIETGQKIKELGSHIMPMQGACFSLNGELVASTGWDKICVCNVATGEKVSEHKLSTGCKASAVQFTADGTGVLGGHSDGITRLWRIKTGQVETEFVTERDMGYSVTAVAASRDGRFIATGTSDKVFVFSATNAHQLYSLDLYRKTVNSVLFSHDSKYLITGGDKAVHLFAAETGHQVKLFEGHAADVSCVKIAPNFKFILSSSKDQSVRLWSGGTQAEALPRAGHAQFVRSVRFSPRSSTIVASSSDDRTAVLWDIETGQPTFSFKFTSQLNIAVLSPDGTVLAVGCDDNSVVLVAVETVKIIKTFTGHSGLVTSASFSSDGLELVSGSRDATVRTWSIVDERQILSLRSEHGEVTSVLYSLDGRSIIAAGDSFVKIRSRDGQVIHDLTIPKKVLSLALSADGNFLAGAGHDGLRLFNINNDYHVDAFIPHEQLISAVCFSRTGTHVIYGGEDGVITIYDIAAAAPVRYLQGHMDRIFGIDVSSDNMTIASCGLDKSIRLWKMPSAETMTVSSKVVIDCCRRVICAGRVLSAKQLSLVNIKGLTPSARTLLYQRGAVVSEESGDELTSEAQVELVDATTQRLVDIEARITSLAQQVESKFAVLEKRMNDKMDTIINLLQNKTQ